MEGKGQRAKGKGLTVFDRDGIKFIIIISAFVLGWFVNVVFVGAVLIALAFEFSGDNAWRGVFAAVRLLALLPHCYFSGKV